MPSKICPVDHVVRNQRGALSLAWQEWLSCKGKWMNDLRLWACIIFRTTNIKILRCDLAENVKKLLHQKASCTCSLSIFPHSTNQIIDLWLISHMSLPLMLSFLKLPYFREKVSEILWDISSHDSSRKKCDVEIRDKANGRLWDVDQPVLGIGVHHTTLVIIYSYHSHLYEFKVDRLSRDNIIIIIIIIIIIGSRIDHRWGWSTEGKMDSSDVPFPRVQVQISISFE